MSIRRLSVALTAAVLLGLAGCGGAAPGAASGGSGAAPAGPAVDEAKATTARYTAGPSEFPVSQPLPSRLPPGTTLGYLQCAAPVCAQLADLLQAAVGVMGAQLIVVKGGASTQQLQDAFSSLLERKPAALILPAIDPESVTPQLEQARAAGIPMVSTGIMDIAKYGIGASAFGDQLSTLVGKLQADWVVANYGTQANIVFYTTPELNFFGPEEVAFRAELTKICGSSCPVRTVKVPIASYGTTAPALVVSDLQSHPDTTIAVFGANDPTTGLVAAMKAAGLTTPYIGYGPTPSNLVDIKEGSQPAGLGLDYAVLAWTMVDEAARLILKAPLSPAEQQSLVPVQWLTKDNLPADNSKGWTGYPDYAARFTALWTAPA